ncbi:MULTISPECIES: hypothetical protein [Bacillaceae]|uniref:hypothetical protein n=1 Tax=Bacillaceae TaxID=186817 RepID=UPI001C5954CF|nr:hypothetical protein [Rossellomorea sp. YZS02]MBW3112720.1 hypothetical protein [Bacillus sp. MCCB 382]MDX8342698.1 hypothetical protein [Rossellomorea sp. YZS02]
MDYLLIFGGLLIAFITLRVWFGARRAKIYAEIKKQKYNVMDPALDKITTNNDREPIG